jgi:hypothetical protein
MARHEDHLIRVHGHLSVRSRFQLDLNELEVGLHRSRICHDLPHEADLATE